MFHPMKPETIKRREAARKVARVAQTADLLKRLTEAREEAKAEGRTGMVAFWDDMIAERAAVAAMDDL